MIIFVSYHVLFAHCGRITASRKYSFTPLGLGYGAHV